MTKATETPPTESAPQPVKPRYVRKVTIEMVASAQAQVTIAKKLGKTLPPAIYKIAALGDR